MRCTHWVQWICCSLCEVHKAGSACLCERVPWITNNRFYGWVQTRLLTFTITLAGHLWCRRLMHLWSWQYRTMCMNGGAHLGGVWLIPPLPMLKRSMSVQWRLHNKANGSVCPCQVIRCKVATCGCAPAPHMVGCMIQISVFSVLCVCASREYGICVQSVEGGGV